MQRFPWSEGPGLRRRDGRVRYYDVSPASCCGDSLNAVILHEETCSAAWSQVCFHWCIFYILQTLNIQNGHIIQIQIYKSSKKYETINHPNLFISKPSELFLISTILAPLRPMLFTCIHPIHLSESSRINHLFSKRFLENSIQ